MEIEGKIIQELPMQEGISKAGRAWKKREWVLETFGTYPRTVKFHVFGDRCETINIEVGKTYAVSFDLESREFQGRWYTDVSCYAVRELTQAAPAQPSFQGGAPVAPAAPIAPVSDFMPEGGDSNDDLPF